ncbi:MAG TPA: alpha-galactosidase [Tepidisphaeraceae bacterium]|nr:alpha-galactosidase [Tepidisphaeraceae bacterium]
MSASVTSFDDFPATEWVLHFENIGKSDSPIIENLLALDLRLPKANWRLHHSNGAPANPTDFEPRVDAIDAAHPITLGGGGGRSSNKDFTFFKLEAEKRSLIVAVGWSGQWQANLKLEGDQLHVTAGLELTHFLLHPGEKIRSPSILILDWTGDTLEANAQFRQLIYKHYAATRNGKKPLLTLFCNTAFTRGGMWLNECNEQNQISLIKAYAPMGLEALITDAGWFEGGWPSGAGNWTARKDAYPHGMAPVASAAKENGMSYGLWFEPERVVKGTSLHKDHPEWCLSDGRQDVTYLADFGRPEVQDYFFKIVKGFMDLPGFRFYRQDFNMDPLEFWRHNDAPDRQGIAEMKYVEGLYAYWDRIAETWPDSIREECASGGRRIDLETVRRMHIHQDSDYWFDNDVDQAQAWSLSQYLPNNCFTTPLVRLDDYSFHSTLPNSLCMGWIADAPDFDSKRGAELLKRYRELRHLLIGAWYPLTPYTRDPAKWIASQFHRPDLNEGMILVFRHAKAPEDSITLKLHGLDASATYELHNETTGSIERKSGRKLMDGLTIKLAKTPQSELISYKRVP